MEPSVILKDRKNENGMRDFLVKWADGEEDSWVSHRIHGVNNAESKAMTRQRAVAISAMSTQFINGWYKNEVLLKLSFLAGEPVECSGRRCRGL